MAFPTAELAPYRRTLTSTEASLAIDSHIDPNGTTHFNTVLSGFGSRVEAHKSLPTPDEETDKQAYLLASPEYGIPSQMSHLGPFAHVVRHLGFAYGEQTDTTSEAWKMTTSFSGLSLEATDKQAQEIFPSNGQQLVPTDLGLYRARPYMEHVQNGQRIISHESMPWLIHDRVIHELAERALGPTFIDLRQQTFKELLPRRSDEELAPVMLHDDLFTSRITRGIAKSNGDTVPVQKASISLPRVINWYFASDHFHGTPGQRQLAYRPRQSEEYAPGIMDISREIKSRLVNAAAALEVKDA